MGKILNRRDEHTELNTETGEFKRVFTDTHIGYVDTEPDYIKIYINTQLCLNNLNPELTPYILAFAPFMSYANDPTYKHMVRTDIMVKESVAKTLKVGVRRVEQIIKILVGYNIFIPVYARKEKNNIITEKKRRGLYFVNPQFVAKGAWKDIKGLRQEIDYVKGTTSCLIIDKDGKREFSTKLRTQPQQITMDEYVQELEKEKYS